MSQRKKIVRVLAALLLTVLLWSVFLLIRGLFERHVSHHEQFIPTNAESVLEIKSEKLVRTFIEDVLSAGSVDDQLNDYLGGSSEDDSDSYGIDYLGNCYIFKFQSDLDDLTGILVNISNEDQFKKAMDKSLTDGFGYSVNNGVGLMLFDLGSNLRNHTKLCVTAQNLIKQPSKFDLTRLESKETGAKVNYWSKEYAFNDHKKFANIRLALTIEGAQLEIKGDADLQSSISKTHPILKPKDLSIQTQYIPKPMNDFWIKHMRLLGLPFPKITYVSGNYHYSEPSPIPELSVLPNFDAIYAFEKNFQIRIPLISLSASGNIHSLNLKSFNIGDKKIYYEQIDSKTIYLGQSPYEAITNQKNALFEVKGSLKQLLEIRNGGMAERFLQLSPEYNAAQRYLSNIDHSNFHIQDRDDKKVDIVAKISFKKGRSALNETVLLLIDLGLF